MISMKAEFELSGMHCESCALDIKETLEETPGVRSAEVSFSKARAVIDYDEQAIEPSAVRQKINDLGYQANFLQVK